MQLHLTLTLKIFIDHLLCAKNYTVKDDYFLCKRYKPFQLNLKENTLWENVINNLSLNFKTIKLSLFSNTELESFQLSCVSIVF